MTNFSRSNRPAPGRLVLASVALTTGLVLGTHASAADVNGRYTIIGNAPQGNAKYEGEALVRRSGDTYSVAWRIGPERHLGTGLLTGDQFSVVFSGGLGTIPGVATYTVKEDGSLAGKYAAFGGTEVGIETWTPSAGASAPPNR